MLADCAALKETAVVGRPDERWGEVAVVARNDDSTVGADEIMALFEGRIARYKHPRDVIFLENLPGNAMGKILKDDPRRIVRERLA